MTASTNNLLETPQVKLVDTTSVIIKTKNPQLISCVK